jgi:uncharacterized glyoxalase superfamily protein PhnB
MDQAASAFNHYSTVFSIMCQQRFSEDDEPEDAGLIQSVAPTEDELREISLFIAESKRRWASQIKDAPDLPGQDQPQR